MLSLHLSFSDTGYVDGWNCDWPRNDLPYVGGCFRGRLQNLQLVFILLQPYAHPHLHTRLPHLQNKYTGKNASKKDTNSYFDGHSQSMFLWHKGKFLKMEP